MFILYLQHCFLSQQKQFSFCLFVYMSLALFWASSHNSLLLFSFLIIKTAFLRKAVSEQTWKWRLHVILTQMVLPLNTFKMKRSVRLLDEFGCDETSKVHLVILNEEHFSPVCGNIVRSYICFNDFFRRLESRYRLHTLVRLEESETFDTKNS